MQSVQEYYQWTQWVEIQRRQSLGWSLLNIVIKGERFWEREHNGKMGLTCRLLFQKTTTSSVFRKFPFVMSHVHWYQHYDEGRTPPALLPPARCLLCPRAEPQAYLVFWLCKASEQKAKKIRFFFCLFLRDWKMEGKVLFKGDHYIWK